jgi:hypothetical protein
MKTAHPRVIEALRNGTITIHGAMLLCKLPRAEQLEKLIRQSEKRAINKVIRKSIGPFKKKQPFPETVSMLNALRQQEERQPGSVVVRVEGLARTVILVGQDLLAEAYSQKESDLA